jgi:DNA-binding response OmpR family regulator
VEDYPPLATAVGLSLAREGYAVDRAATVAQARAFPGPYHTGVIDIDLPDGEGPDLAGELIARDRVRRVVFFTATTDEAALREAHRLGRVVRKELGVGALLRVVQEDWYGDTQTQLRIPEIYVELRSAARAARAARG